MSKKNKKKLNVSEGIVHITATFNNTIVSISDMKGNVICISSAGQSNFKGARKGTPFAAQLSAQNCIKVVEETCGMKFVDIQVKGPGPGRESAMRAIGASSLEVRSITDKTPLPHNGCRPPKKRRV